MNSDFRAAKRHTTFCCMPDEGQPLRTDDHWLFTLLCLAGWCGLMMVMLVIGLHVFQGFFV